MTHLIEQNAPAITVAEAHRRHIGDVRDALKWAAAFSAAALLSTAQIFRARPMGELVPVTEGLGLAIGSLAFLASIVGAGLFLITFDLPTAEWLRLLSRASIWTCSRVGLRCRRIRMRARRSLRKKTRGSPPRLIALAHS